MLRALFDHCKSVKEKESRLNREAETCVTQMAALDGCIAVAKECETLSATLSALRETPKLETRLVLALQQPTNSFAPAAVLELLQRWGADERGRIGKEDLRKHMTLLKNKGDIRIDGTAGEIKDQIDTMFDTLIKRLLAPPEPPNRRGSLGVDAQALRKGSITGAPGRKGSIVEARKSSIVAAEAPAAATPPPAPAPDADWSPASPESAPPKVDTGDFETDEFGQPLEPKLDLPAALDSLAKQIREHKSKEQVLRALRNARSLFGASLAPSLERAHERAAYGAAFRKSLTLRARPLSCAGRIHGCGQDGSACQGAAGKSAIPILYTGHSTYSYHTMYLYTSTY